jgi:hypothetical protein
VKVSKQGLGRDREAASIRCEWALFVHADMESGAKFETFGSGGITAMQPVRKTTVFWTGEIVKWGLCD